MRKTTSILLLTCLAACATPTTTLKNEKTGQVVTCGGGTAGSIAGGMIGYNIQKSNDQDCVNNYKNQGFKVEDVDLH